LLNRHSASRQSVEEKPKISAEANILLTLEPRWSGNRFMKKIGVELKKLGCPGPAFSKGGEEKIYY
jgi:hypothetical protein